MHRLINRLGVTLIELLVVLTVVAVLALVTLPPVRTLRDRASVASARVDVMASITLARHAAALHTRRTAVAFDSAATSLVVAADRETLAVSPLGRTHGVSLRTSRDSIAFGPTGLGYGASNATIVVARGKIADTIWVSRLGRVRP